MSLAALEFEPSLAATVAAVGLRAAAVRVEEVPSLRGRQSLVAMVLAEADLACVGCGPSLATAKFLLDPRQQEEPRHQPPSGDELLMPMYH